MDGWEGVRKEQAKRVKKRVIWRLLFFSFPFLSFRFTCIYPYLALILILNFIFIKEAFLHPVYG